MMSTSLTDTVFVAVKDSTKTRYYSNLNQFLMGVSQGNCVHWRSHQALPFTLYFSEGTLTGWTPNHEALLRQAIEDVLAWPLPGSAQAVKQNLPWTDGDDSAYNPGSPASRKLFVSEARDYILDRVGL